MNKSIRLLITIGGCLAVGAALGILFAPDEGAETRKKIAKRSKKLAGYVSESFEEGKESVEELKEALQKQLNKVNRKMEDAIGK